MNEEQFNSTAFQEAALRSERLRIFAVIGFFGVLIVVTTLRVFVVRTAAENTSWGGAMCSRPSLIGYELWTLRKVDLAA